MLLHIYFVAAIVKLRSIDARVYCQDSNASPWVLSGFTCPVVCQNVINAIEKLKRMDFDNIVHRTTTERPQTAGHTHEVEIASNEINIDQDTDDRDSDAYDETKGAIHGPREVDDKGTANDTIDEKRFYKDVIKLAQLGNKTFQRRCAERSDNAMMRLIKCARKVNYERSFLTIMTDLLNKYGKLKYEFTEDMTEILLENILGTSTDLRNNIFDVNKLLKYLRQAIDSHKKHENNGVISIKPKRCTSLSLPGCFCKAGFVENSGQCVKPSDCVDEMTHAAYLPRVIVL